MVSTGNKILIGVAIMLMGLMILVMASGVSIWGTYNGFIESENSITSQYKQNQNNYDNMWKKFKEAAQVNDMYAGDLEKVYKSAISGRYGTDGSKAVVQMIKEQNPNLDVKLYTKLQSLIEGGRNSFEEQQKFLLDKKRRYQDQLRRFPGNLVAMFFKFPTINLDEFDIVTSAETEDTFKSKKADSIKLR